MANLKCAYCGCVTRHTCLDDTPQPHRYSVKCCKCGRFYTRDVTYAKLQDILEEDEQWR